MLGPSPKYFRTSERRPVWAELTLYDGYHRLANGTVENVGLGGMYVEVDDGTPAAGNTIRLEFRLPGDGDHVHHCTARVVHVDNHGLGLEFENYDPQTVDVLRAMMIRTIDHH